jgi:phosphoribosyl-AMP cyclohydrolase
MPTSDIVYNQDGLVCVVVQSVFGRVLMVAWMNAEALSLTLSTGVMTYWSRSRQEIWVKGSTSGNQQKLIKLERDCDGDALLATVEEAGPACHNGTQSCFDTEVIFEGEKE